MINEFAIIMSTCEKFSDLWEQHIKLLKHHWIGDWPVVYIVTDSYTNKSFEGVQIMIFDGDMPVRLKKAFEVIKEKYVLLTLDDYYPIYDIFEERINYLVTCVNDNNIDYLRLFERRVARKRNYTKLKKFSTIDLTQKYSVCLYPAIWNKEFFINCVDVDESPWEFEPKLTQKAIDNNAKCYNNYSGSYEILDVVRKGCVLHSANRYFKKNKINIGDRPIITWKNEIKLCIADYIYWYMPKWFYRFTRRIAIRFGMKFYSEE